MSRYGVLLASSDLPEAIDVFELNEDLWVEKRVLKGTDQGIQRKLILIEDAGVLQKALELPHLLAAVFSDGGGVWGPMKLDYIRDRLDEKRPVT